MQTDKEKLIYHREIMNYGLSDNLERYHSRLLTFSNPYLLYSRPVSSLSYPVHCLPEIFHVLPM